MSITRREFITVSLAIPAFASRCGRDGYANRLGASTACVAGASLLEAVRTIEGFGFDTIELIAYVGATHSVGEIPGFDYAVASESERRAVFDATRSFRHISAHMPFSGVDLLSRDSVVRAEGNERIRRAMDGLAFLEGSMAVVHVGWPGEDTTYRDLWPLMLDTFCDLGDYAAELDLKVGLETMQPDSVADYSDLVLDIDHPAVGATVDTGHIRGAADIGLPADRRHTPEGTERFNDVLNETARALGPKLIHVHLTDVRLNDWVDHREVGSGIIDFPRFIETLYALDYDGLLVFELEEPDQVAALQASKSHVERILHQL